MSNTKQNDRDLEESVEKDLAYMNFVQREFGTHHHSYNDELKEYNSIRNGSLKGLEEARKAFESTESGKLSEDPLRNEKYLFVASATLATRFAIEGGMDSMEAYNLSDIYIQKVDICTMIEEVKFLQKKMEEDFTKRVAEIKINSSKPIDNFSDAVKKGTEYIYLHLHENIKIKDVADYIHLSPSYYALIFKKETGETLGNYIIEKRIETAKNMLLYSNYSLTEIGSFLAFSTTSHFIQLFKKHTGVTPKVFRRKYAGKNFEWNKNEK